MLLLLDAASEFQPFCQLSLRVNRRHRTWRLLTSCVFDFLCPCGHHSFNTDWWECRGDLLRLTSFGKTLVPFFERARFRSKTLHLGVLSTFACEQQIEALSDRILSARL